MTVKREKIVVELNSEILAMARMLVDKEGRQLQALVDEALADLIEKRRKSIPRSDVMGAYLSSHEKYASLYKKLSE